MTVAGRTVWGAEPAEMSLLHVLFYVRSGHGFDMLMDVEGGAQEDRLVGGSQLLATGLAGQLAGPLELSAPVERIAERDRSSSGSARGDGARQANVRYRIARPHRFQPLASRHESSSASSRMADQGLRSLLAVLARRRPQRQAPATPGRLTDVLWRRDPVGPSSARRSEGFAALGPRAGLSVIELDWRASGAPAARPRICRLGLTAWRRASPPAVHWAE
jgi:hypothetical protein